jgi:predicted dehydrogenase
LHLDRGAKGVFTVSQVSWTEMQTALEINGSEGSLGWNAEDPNTLWIGRRNQPNEIRSRILLY